MAKPMTLAPRGMNVGPVEVTVRRKCRHGEAHPHSVYDTHATWSWCVDGDSRTLTIRELQVRVQALLESVAPRMAVVDAGRKAEQLVDEFVGMLRGLS